MPQLDRLYCKFLDRLLGIFPRAYQFIFVSAYICFTGEELLGKQEPLPPEE